MPPRIAEMIKAGAFDQKAGEVTVGSLCRRLMGATK
jgi:hypothetical protein